MIKSDTNIRSKSLGKYKELYAKQTKIRIRYSLNNLKLDNDLLNIPLYMVDQTDHLLSLALETIQ